MLPTNVATIYHQYRHDTNVVASWLVKTGRETGFTKFDLTPPSAARRKGKARKKKGPSDPVDQLQEQEDGKKHVFVLPIKQFVPLAEHIAATDSVKKAPVWFRAAIERAVEVREGFGTRIPEQGKTAEESVFFVDILAKVQKVLGDKLPELPPEMVAAKEAAAAAVEKRKEEELEKKRKAKEEREKRKQEAQAEGKEDKQAEVSATLDDLDSETTVVSIAAVDVIDPEIEPILCEAEMSETMDDVLFGFSALVQDSQVLREHIAEFWAAYARGESGLAAAAVATDACLGVVRQMENAIKPLLDGQKRHIVQLIQAHFIGLCQAAGQDPTAKENTKDEMNFACYEIGDSTMHNVYTLLKDFRDLLTPKTYPAYGQGHWGKYNPSAKREEMTNREKWTEDKILLLESLPDLVILGREIIGMQRPLDEITRLVSEMYQTKDITFALVFAAQIFLDIHRITRAKAARPFVEMSLFSGMVSDSVNDALKWKSQMLTAKSKSKTSKADAADKETVMMRNLVIDGARWRNDPINQFKAKHKLDSSKNAPTPSSDPNALLKRHPTFCGIWMHALRLQYHYTGVVFANTTKPAFFNSDKSSVGAGAPGLLAGYLYNAVEQEKLLQDNLRWKDMDTALTCQKLHMFPGLDNSPGKPVQCATSHEDLYRCFCKVLGLGNKEAKEKDNEKGKDNDEPDHGVFDYGGVVSREFNLGLSTGVTEEGIDQLSRSGNFSVTGVAGATTNGEQKNGKAENTNDKSNAAGGKAHKQNQRFRLSAPALSQGLIPLLDAEVLELSFDYFRFHMQCWKLVEQTLKKIEQDDASNPVLDAGKKCLGVAATDDKSDECRFLLLAAGILASFKEGDSKGAKNLLGKYADALEKFVRDGEGEKIVDTLRRHGLQTISKTQ